MLALCGVCPMKKANHLVRLGLMVMPVARHRRQTWGGMVPPLIVNYLKTAISLLVMDSHKSASVGVVVLLKAEASTM